MNEEHFNLEIRKFLKTVGVTAQREIEKSVREALASGTLSGDEALSVSVRLQIEGIGLSLPIDGAIGLEPK
ncbi:MAG: DUF6494 family protein [Alphaproteobacteria bacterium]